jgi:hypothetical protein
LTNVTVHCAGTFVSKTVWTGICDRYGVSHITVVERGAPDIMAIMGNAEKYALVTGCT